jgi:hypothetical protein
MYKTCLLFKNVVFQLKTLTWLNHFKTVIEPTIYCKIRFNSQKLRNKISHTCGQPLKWEGGHCNICLITIGLAPGKSNTFYHGLWIFRIERILFKNVGLQLKTLTWLRYNLIHRKGDIVKTRACQGWKSMYKTCFKSRLFR